MFDALGILALGEIPIYRLEPIIITGFFHKRIIPQALDDDDELLLLAWVALMQPRNIRIKTGE